MSAPALTPEARALVRLSAALAVGGEGVLDPALEEAATRAQPPAVEETLLQSYLFLGYPAALNAFARWRRLRPAPPASSAPDDWAAWVERGSRVCAAVYGGQYERLRENVAALHPDMERWMVAEGYGKVLGRPGLDLRVRELCIAALLAGLDAEPQLYAHLRGALNAGASAREVEAMLEAIGDLLPSARASAAATVWTAVRARRG